MFLGTTFGHEATLERSGSGAIVTGAALLSRFAQESLAKRQEGGNRIEQPVHGVEPRCLAARYPPAGLCAYGPNRRRRARMASRARRATPDQLADDSGSAVWLYAQRRDRCVERAGRPEDGRHGQVATTGRRGSGSTPWTAAGRTCSSTGVSCQSGAVTGPTAAGSRGAGRRVRHESGPQRPEAQRLEFLGCPEASRGPAGVLGHGFSSAATRNRGQWYRASTSSCTTRWPGI